jgi:hypothetical protein
MSTAPLHVLKFKIRVQRLILSREDVNFFTVKAGRRDDQEGNTA